jgi:hypothetical protein
VLEIEPTIPNIYNKKFKVYEAWAWKVFMDCNMKQSYYFKNLELYKLVMDYNLKTSSQKTYFCSHQSKL